MDRRRRHSTTRRCSRRGRNLPWQTDGVPADEDVASHHVQVLAREGPPRQLPHDDHLLHGAQPQPQVADWATDYSNLL